MCHCHGNSNHAKHMQHESDQLHSCTNSDARFSAVPSNGFQHLVSYRQQMCMRAQVFIRVQEPEPNITILSRYRLISFFLHPKTVEVLGVTRTGTRVIYELVAGKNKSTFTIFDDNKIQRCNISFILSAHAKEKKLCAPF